MIAQKVKEEIRRPSAIRAMFEKGGQLKKIYGEENVFDFSLGNPNLPAPDRVNDVIKLLVNENLPGMHGYMPNAGYEDVRSEIAENLNSKSAASRFDSGGIVLTCGAAAGLNVILRSVLDRGDEVITAAPFFVEYRAYTENAGGRLVAVNSDPSSFLFDPSDIKSAITDKTKAILLNSPNNPSGVIYPPELLKELNDILTTNKEKTGRAVYVISDEPYRELVYDADLPVLSDIFDDCITVYSFSKSLSLAGERIGYIAVPKGADDYDDLTGALILANRVLGFVNAPALFQRVIARCLDEKVDVAGYKKKRDILYKHITGLGFECFLPSGAFYLFPRSPISDDASFCNDYALKYNILAAPGSGFGFGGFFRLAYCVSDKTIEASLPAFEKLAKEFF